MLTTAQLRQIAGQTRRDITNIEIEVILTFLLQLFHDRRFSEHLAFKGGTMLRKMIFGQSGRLSTDLDFTRTSTATDEEIVGLLIDLFHEPYLGLSFALDDKDIYITDTSCAANPICYHDGNKNGVKIKVQISLREAPLLPVVPVPQKEQTYFKLLLFKPADFPCLSFPEAISEKIRAATQRAKIRDLYDLHEISKTTFDRDLVRSLAVLKLWQSQGDELSYQQFKRQIEDGKQYDVNDLTNLLTKGQKVELRQMIVDVVNRYDFLDRMTEDEARLAADKYCRMSAEYAAFRDQVVAAGIRLPLIDL